MPDGPKVTEPADAGADAPGEDLTIAALLISRLCHDLSAPAGAVLNGLELLRDDPGSGKDSLDLVEYSATEAVRRVEFYRLAFGASGGFGVDVPLADLRSVALAFFTDRKVTLAWPPSAEAPPSLGQTSGKLLMNLILLAMEALPRGGAVRVAVSVVELTVAAEGAGASLAPARRDALAGKFAPPLDARLVLPYHAGILARAAGTPVGVTEEPNLVRLGALIRS